jgi:uncharacterized membrane protein YdbT with pleckstrin-like domain
MRKNKTQAKNQTPLSVSNPSQFINIGWYIIATPLLLVHPMVGGLAIAIAIYKFIEVNCWSYEFYDDYIIEKKGVFNVTQETINYFRIKSIMIEQPLWMRIFGLSIVQVTTSEKFKPVLVFYGVENGEIYRDYVQQQSSAKRKEMGIKDLDVFYSA